GSGVALAEPRRGLVHIAEMELDPAEVVLLHRHPGCIAERRVQVQTLQVHLARTGIVLLQPDAGRLKMQGRCLRLAVPGGSSPVARLTRESDDLVVPAVPKSDPRESGQRVTLPADVVGRACDPKRLLVSLQRPLLIAGPKRKDPVGRKRPHTPYGN